jgi:hypothetical protein
MLKYLSAALLAAGLLATPAMAANATEPATQQTLITKEVADKAVPGKRYRGCCCCHHRHHWKHRHHRHHHHWRHHRHHHHHVKPSGPKRGY